jgi:uncharacterized protein
MKIALGITLLVLGAPVTGDAEDADCGSAEVPVARLICESDSLVLFDDQLNRAIAMRTQYLREDMANLERAEHRDWLAGVRDQCVDEDCLTLAYLNRLEKLQSIKTPRAEARYVVSKEEILFQENAFIGSLQKLGIHAYKCPVMVNLVASEMTFGRDASYAAFCGNPETTEFVMVCDDTMVGKLTIKFSGFSFSAFELADFARANCPPGG